MRFNRYALLMAWVTLLESISFLVDAVLNGVTREMTDRHTRRFGERLLAVTQTRLEVFNADHLDKNCSYVFMSNHQSMMDIPVIFKAVPQSVRMVGKEILFKVPFFGAAMRGAGIIPIDRKNLSRAKEQLEDAKKRLQEGLSLWISPEGTRSRAGELLPFKKGGFHVALALETPIVPVYIRGAAEVMPADSLSVVTGKTIGVYFGEPIQTHNKTLPELMIHVRKSILELEKNG